MKKYVKLDSHFPDTTIENEKAFVEHIVNFARTNSLAETIYIFEAFDESEKPGAESEKHFGIEYENRQVIRPQV